MLADVESISAATVALLWGAAVAWLSFRAARQYRAYEALKSDAIPGAAPKVTVVVPVRNEVETIGRCLAGLTAQDYPRDSLNIVVVDDASTDATVDLALRSAEADSRIQIIDAGPLAAGWTGKSHACWQGAKWAKGAWVCFIDADTVPRPALLRAAIAAALNGGIDFLSLEPKQQLVTPWERLIIPSGLCALAFVGDLRRVGNSSNRFAIANGQFILIRRSTYDRVGGHFGVREEVAEDGALAARVKAIGGRVALMDGAPLISARMYRTLPRLWEGLAKNIVETLGGARKAAIIVPCGLVAAWASLAVPLALALIFVPSTLGIAALALAALASLAAASMHVAAARYFAIPLWYGLLFPIGYTIAAALAVDGLIAHCRGRVTWKGRTYQTRK